MVYTEAQVGAICALAHMGFPFTEIASKLGVNAQCAKQNWDKRLSKVGNRGIKTILKEVHSEEEITTPLDREHSLDDCDGPGKVDDVKDLQEVLVNVKDTKVVLKRLINKAKHVVCSG